MGEVTRLYLFGLTGRFVPPKETKRERASLLNRPAIFCSTRRRDRNRAYGSEITSHRRARERCLAFQSTSQLWETTFRTRSKVFGKASGSSRRVRDSPFLLSSPDFPIARASTCLFHSFIAYLAAFHPYTSPSTGLSQPNSKFIKNRTFVARPDSPRWHKRENFPEAFTFS